MINPLDFALRPLTELDLPNLLEWRNLERVRTNMYTDRIISMTEHQYWFEKQSGNSANEKYFIFESNKRPLGFVSFTRYNPDSGTCYWAFYLGETNVPRGTGAIMEYIAIEHAFRELAIRKLCCEVFVFNTSVIKLHRKFGFMEEGRFTEHMLKNEKYEDIVSLALFRREWVNIRAKLKRLCFR